MTSTYCKWRAGRALSAAVYCLILAACGGGGGGGSAPAPAVNTAPVSNAGADQTAQESSMVQLTGIGTDSDAGDSLTFVWIQTAGTAVTINNANNATASFTAPSLPGGGSEVLTFQLTVTDNAGLSDSDSVTVTVLPAGSVVTISGTMSFEYVPANTACIGLNYTATETRPIRGATVQVVDTSTSAVLGSVVTDDSGGYTLNVSAGISVFLSVRAELKRSGTPSWDVEVRDNTSNTTAPLEQRLMYALDSGSFDSGSTDQTRNLTATTGWNGVAYSGARAAAPFAILDSIYDAMQLVLQADNTATFEPLDVFWSVNNVPEAGDGTTSESEDIAAGRIGTSYYSSDNKMFLLGAADSDTEEFDSHVIVHEWGHFFEDAFSRSDSIGGVHGPGDRLDMRLAFGEGWATALSGMALNSSLYCDTSAAGQSNGFSINIENSSQSRRGWFNEFSVMELVFDLWDDSVEVGRGDSGSIGFTPIYDTMVNRQSVTSAHTSIFSFTTELKDESPASAALVDELLAYHNVNGSGVYGDGETNDANSATPQDALPVYTQINPTGVPLNICVNNEHDNSQSNGNKLSQHRFLRFSVAAPSRYAFRLEVDAATLASLPNDDPANDSDQSDPDAEVFLNGQVVAQGFSGTANVEAFESFGVLAVGNYVMDLTDWRYADEQTVAAYPNRVCFDVTVQPTT